MLSGHPYDQVPVADRPHLALIHAVAIGIQIHPRVIYLPMEGTPWLQLFHLVESCPDSLSFEHFNGAIRYITQRFGAVLWQAAVGRIVEDYFMDQLKERMPEGKWNLGMVYTPPDQE